MALLSDDTTPRYQVRDAAYYAELRRKLNAPIQAIPAATGSLSPEGRPALPSWVQAKLDEQERAKAKAEADALRGLAPITQPTPPTPKPSAKLPKLATPQPKSSFTPQFTAPATPAPAPAVDRAFQRHTPEYNARINEVLQARTQGVAPGYGSPSVPSQPAQRTDPKPPELQEMLGPNGGGFGFAVPVSSPISTQEPPRQPTPIGPPPLSPEVEEALFASVLARDDRSARDDGPSVFDQRTRRNESLMFAADEVEPMGSPARRVDSRPPEPIPDMEDEWVLPTEIMGVPVTVDREMVQLAYRANTIFGISPEEQAALDALPPDERKNIDELARELWVESQGQALAEHKSRESGEAQPNLAFTDWKKIFELSTGYDFPDGGGLMPLGRDLLELRSGFDTMDGLTRSERNGTLLVFGPSVGDPELLDDILNAYYPDDRARFEAVQEHFPLAQFVPNEAGFGTVLREDIESIPLVGDFLENFVDKATAPATWMSGPTAGAASVVGGGVASNVYEEARAFGLSPEQAFAVTQLIITDRSKKPWGKRGAVWAYVRELAGDRLDDFDRDDWIPIGPMLPSPQRNVRNSLDESTGDILGDLEDSFLARGPATSRDQETSDVWNFQRQRNSEARAALSQQQLVHGDDPPDPSTYANLYAELYWSTVPLADPETGLPDIEGWKARRQAVAAEAEALGLDPTYVTGRGYGTYHEVRFLHDEVRGAVERFERTAFDGI